MVTPALPWLLPRRLLNLASSHLLKMANYSAVCFINGLTQATSCCCARAASLLYSFNGEDMEEGSELRVLSELAEVSPSTFYRQMADLKRRGLLQSRGKMRAILPQAIANYLANECLQEISPSKVTYSLLTTPHRASRLFGNRLSNLGNSSVGSQVVTSWLSKGGALSKIASLNNEEMLTFKRVAPINPSMALAAVEDFLHDGELGIRLAHEIPDL